MTWRLASLLGRHGGDYGTKDIQVQLYNRLVINNDSQKHNYICKYNNLPTTCFGLIRPSSCWNTASEENYLSDLNAGGKGGTRSRLQIWG